MDVKESVFQGVADLCFLILYEEPSGVSQSGLPHLPARARSKGTFPRGLGSSLCVPFAGKRWRGGSLDLSPGQAS